MNYQQKVAQQRQISLFEFQEKELRYKFADRIKDEFNKLDTVFKGAFYVAGCSLEMWDHVKRKTKTLEIVISALGACTENSLMYFGGDKKSHENICNICSLSDWMGKLAEDKDFFVCPTPWRIYIYYHNFELKDIKL